MLKSVAITGGIGAGKSTVCKLIASYGYPVFDADKLARDALLINSVKLQIKKEFGIELFDEKDNLNRLKMRNLVFENREKKQKLEEIIHPEVRKSIDEIKHKFSELPSNSLLFFEIQLLFENSQQDNFDSTILITSSEKIRTERLINSRNLSPSEVKKIIQAQMPDSQKKKLAKIIIENNGDEPELEKKVRELLAQLRAEF